MGFRSANGCHGQLEDAALIDCAALVGVSSAGAVRCVGISPAVGGYVLNVETQPASGPAVTSALTMQQIGCDPGEGYADLAELFALAIPAVLAVFLVREFVYRLVAPQ
jgi:hypothetical protein